MKKIFIMLLPALGVFFFPACDEGPGIQALLLKDCTGTYLRVEGKDYQVCNISKTERIANGTTVIAVFDKSDDCNNSGVITCYMLHENEGWIKINQIRKL